MTEQCTLAGLHLLNLRLSNTKCRPASRCSSSCSGGPTSGLGNTEAWFRHLSRPTCNLVECYTMWPLHTYSMLQKDSAAFPHMLSAVAGQPSRIP